MREREKVQIFKRARGGGRYSYDVRWYDPKTGKRHSKAYRDAKRAGYEAGKLEKQLAEGMYSSVQRVEWQVFVDDHVGMILGAENARHARFTLEEFGKVCKPEYVSDATYSMIEQYLAHLRGKGNEVATQNLRMRYLRGGFNEAIKREYLTKSPMKGWKWGKVPRREKRILKPDEEVKLLASCKKLYGEDMEIFARFLLETWARLSEATKLQWEDVNFEDGSVYFRNTKSHEDRYVAIAATSGLWGDLRRLQAKTLQDGGPFVAYSDKSILARKWNQAVADAGIPPITRHDCRRTGISRALVGGMPPAVVQVIAGHSSIETTMRYYTEVSKQDVRAAVDKLHAAVG